MTMNPVFSRKIAKVEFISVDSTTQAAAATVPAAADAAAAATQATKNLVYRCDR